VSNGTVSLPALAAISDTDTGVYFPAANQVGIAAGGVASARFEAAAIALLQNTSVTGTFAVSGASTLAGALTVNGNTTLGDSSSDTLTVNATSTFAGDVTITGAFAPPNGSITNARLADVPTQTIKGRTTAGTGIPQDLTSAEATAILAAVVGDSGSGGTKGLAPAPGSGDAAARKFLRADGTWATSVPVGSVIMYADDVVPTGWLECNAAAVSRTTYAALFAVIGTTFGVGDGSTTFNLPEMRGEFARGWDNGRGVDPARAFGSAQTDEFEAHVHSVTPPAANDDTSSGLTTTGTGGAETITPYNTASAGGAAETRPRNIALMFIIKF
jgi:microcystin-dependent protein